MNVFPVTNKGFDSMLRQKYEVDREFDILIQLVGEMDDLRMLEIDKILNRRTIILS